MAPEPQARRTGRASEPRRRRGGSARWIIPALALQAVLAAIDIVSGDEVVFTTTFVLAPFAVAVSGRTKATAALAVIATALAIASGYWNHYEGSTDHLLRIAIVLSGGLLATLAAAAIERAAEQRRRMAILAALGRLSSAQTITDAIKGLTEALVPAVADGCWVDLIEPDGESRQLFEHGVDAPGTSQSGPARLFDDNARALVPLITAGRVTGYLGLTASATGRNHYDADDLEFFTIVAGRVALVLANARLVTDLKSTQARLDGILNSLAEAVTVNDDQGRTVYANPAATRLLGLASSQQAIEARPGEIAARFAITDEHGQPIDVKALPGRRVVRGEPAPELLTRTVDKATGRAYWLLTKASLLEDQQRKFAVNIIEDVTEAKQAEQRQAFLAQAGQVLASSLDYEQTLKRVAQLAVPWLADWCAVDMPGQDGAIEQVALAHVDPRKVAQAEELRRRYPPEPTAPTGAPHVIRTGEPELLKDINEAQIDEAIADPEEREAIKALRMRSAMVVPMRAGDDTLGAITFVASDSDRRFDEDDFAFAQDLALRAATAVENARLYAAQKRVAHTLQASLLPDALPAVPGYTLAASYQAGELGADVGGDFYDVIATADAEKYLVVLGDVTGKGVEAAALTSLVRHSIRTAARFNPNPSAVLQLVNEILVEQPKLAPVTLAVLLIGRDELTIATAGHPPPLLRRHQTVTPIGPGGILLGVAETRAFEQEAIALDEGDAVLLYTDGVTDTPGRSERFGATRLAETLAHAPAEPAAIVEAIDDALRDFQASTAIDDRALLVLRHS